ncbi:MAG: DUF1266 domain-containing protein [Lachnospiraceae bacterium]|nr:DUF1266 domain-containing protein [Lachnospiraceae bacterium]
MKTRGHRNRFRGLSLMLVLALVIAMLQGCGSKKEEPKDTQKQEEGQTPVENEESTPEKETPQEEEAKAPELSDTVRWFNASYAVLTEINHWDYNLFGGVTVDTTNQLLVQQLLEQWWDVTDRQSADETLEWIVTEGHRTSFAADMQMLDEDGMGEIAPEERAAYLLEYYEVDENQAEIFAVGYSAYEKYGANAIAGWDYCRALNLMGYYYVAGYYTLEEALDLSLDIALAVQPQFESWDELIDSYMYGYEYWQEASSQERRDIYEDLKTREDNPYAVDFKTTLEKTW